MKIATIDLLPFDLPLCKPLQTALGQIKTRSGFLIRVGDHNGNVGIGEANPLAGIGMESLNQTKIALQQMPPSLLGQEIANINAIACLLTNFQCYPAAMHGMELALLDLMAINANIPLANLLVGGAQTRAEIQVNALIGIGSVEMAAEQAKDLCDRGYTCIKIKVGRPTQGSQVNQAIAQFSPDLSEERQEHFAIDYQRIKAVREVGGNYLQIRIDPNQSWSLEQAIDNLTQLAPLKIEYAEQPIDRHDLVGMAKLREVVDVPIAADEAVSSLQELKSLIAAQAADIVILKPMAIGGLWLAKQAADLAIEAGLEVVITNTIDGAIAQLGAMHLAAAIPGLTRACGLATHSFLAQNLVRQEVIERLTPLNGRVWLGNRPGLGISCSELII